MRKRITFEIEAPDDATTFKAEATAIRADNSVLAWLAPLPGTLTVSEATSTPICGNCRYWDFKVSADRSFGRCLHPQIEEFVHISTVKLEPHCAMEVHAYAEVYFEEKRFGCTLFEAG